MCIRDSYQTAQYHCFLADYEDIPNLIHEIGRRREEAFRASGEGTNTALDIDDFDPYFKHLILWDSAQKKIAGAYRLGIGEEIFEKHGGISGFYSSSLFVYKEEFEPTPVSYTHLDVYKRQCRRFSSPRLS